MASGAGLEPRETRTYLEHGDGTDEVRRSQVEAHRLGIAGVPFYVADGRYAFSGTQPVGVFLRVFDVVRAG